MRSWGFKFCYLILALGISVPAIGQTSPPAEQEKGFTEIESFQGSINSSEKLFKLDSTLGYDFNKHFGAFVGAPLYLTHVSNNIATTSTTGTSGSTTITGIGNIYLGLALRMPHPEWNFTSTITAGAPTGSTRKGYSTGRVSVDWSNYLEGTFHRITPFIEAGLANGVPSSPLVRRPYTSLGVLGHLEEGAEYDLGHHFSVGASAYQILPSGSQKVFSQVIVRGKSGSSGLGTSGSPGQGRGGSTGRGQTGSAGQGRQNRPFEIASVTTGTGLTRENGFDTWLGFEPSPLWRVQAGYSRSITFDFDSFTFNIALNLGRLFRPRAGH